MLIGDATDRYAYDDKVKHWVEKTYKVKIDKYFIVDDWSLPSSITEY